MLIKRGAFLLLTSALAHQACTVKNEDNGDDGGEAGESNAGRGAGGKSGSAGSGSSGKSGKAGSAGSAQAGESGAGGEGATSGQGPTAGEAGSGGSAGEAQGGQGGDGQGGEATAGAGGEGGAPSCDDSAGTPGDCTAFDETDCGFERSYCLDAIAHLKPKVAEAATACMLEDTDCSTSGIDPYACLRTALGGACPDATNDEFCADAVVACNDGEAIDAAGCHALVDGLNEDGLALVTSCVDDGCSFGLWSCVESM